MSLPVSAGEEEGVGSRGLEEVSGEGVESPVIKEGSWGEVSGETEKTMIYSLERVIFKVCVSNSLSQSVGIWLRHNAALPCCWMGAFCSDTGLGGVMLVSDWLSDVPLSTSVPSTWQYFISRTPAN